MARDSGCWRRWARGLCALLWLGCLALPIATAQDESPAASATPQALQTVSPDDDAAHEAAALDRPLLQSDMELLIGNVQRPNALAYFGDYLYTVCNGDWTIYRINHRTGETESFVFGVKDGSAMLVESTAAGFDIVIPDPMSGTLWRVDQERKSPVAIASELGKPWGIARVSGDSVLVTNTQDSSVMQVSRQGSAETILTGLRSPTGITRHQDRLYVANGGSARRSIEWFQLSGDGEATPPQSLVSGLQNATTIAMGTDGHLYFAHALGTRGVVGRIDPLPCLEGGCDSSDVEMVVFSDLQAPITLTLSPDMRLFLHSRYRPEIYWAQLGGAESAASSPPP